MNAPKQPHTARQDEIHALRAAFGDGELFLPHAFALRLAGLDVPAIGERLGLPPAEVQRAARRHAGALFGLFIGQRVRERIRTHEVKIPALDVQARDRLTEGLRAVLKFTRLPHPSPERAAWERAMQRVRRCSLFDMIPALERHASRAPESRSPAATGVNVGQTELVEAMRKQRAAAVLQTLAAVVANPVERSILLGLAAAAAFDRTEILARVGLDPVPTVNLKVHFDLIHGSASNELRFGRALQRGEPVTLTEDFDEEVRRAIRASTGISVEGWTNETPQSPVFGDTDEEFFAWRLTHQALFESEFVQLVESHSVMEGTLRGDDVALLEDEEAEVIL